MKKLVRLMRGLCELGRLEPLLAPLEQYGTTAKKSEIPGKRRRTAAADSLSDTFGSKLIGLYMAGRIIRL